ncbi:hypothetical protein RFI_14819 [Reticulomyxa filosa]|uniref:Uncharacterized protein n=1 Tax=Reticulomyxa filosa TaxID=46433 RepID=X6N9I2_RETFI|nr:hypothetical protein RFI_14819 [Reticulomyxa filosa]|eukprot:ETO22379.1 hypothetical protein RFI_14819 [Reticulomyxa filosa]
MSGNHSVELDSLQTAELIQFTNELSSDLKLQWNELKRAQSDIKDTKIKQRYEEQTIVSRLLETIEKLKHHIKVQQSVPKKKKKGEGGGEKGHIHYKKKKKKLNYYCDIIERQNVQLQQMQTSKYEMDEYHSNNINNNGNDEGIKITEAKDGKQFLNSKYFQMKHLVQPEMSHRSKNQAKLNFFFFY